MKNKEQFKFVSALSLVFELGFAIALPIILFLFLGRWLDSMLHTSPLLLIIGILVGLCVAFISVFFLVQALIDEDT
jgi:F0F1-type ATP synthase assembly protein I